MKTPALWIVALIALSAAAIAVSLRVSKEDAVLAIDGRSSTGSLDAGAFREEDDLATETEARGGLLAGSQAESDESAVSSRDVDAGDLEPQPQSTEILRNQEQPPSSSPVLALPGLAGFEVPDRPIFRATASELAAQNDDPSWSSETEARLIREISAVLGLRASFIDVQCRSNLCGVVVVFPDRSALIERPEVGSGLEGIGDPTGLERRLTFTHTAQNGAFFRTIYFQRKRGSETQSVGQKASIA